MMFLKKMSSFLFVLFFGITGIFAQLPQQPSQPAEVSDSELVQFTSAYTKIQSIDQQLQQKMVSAIDKEGIEIQKFNEILNAQQDENQEVDATKEELESFSSAYQAIEQIQNQAQKDMQKIIADNKLSVARYQEIMMAIQSNPELAQKLQKMLQEEE